MPDFTSALYLGLQHPSRSLRPWHQLTTGAPAALVEPAEAREIGRSLAELQGCEAATLATSTLHLAWDLFDLLAQTPITLFMDAGAYPISRWGAQRAAMRGALVQTFPHHDAAALGRALSAAPRGRVPVIVTDGFCPSCGRVAPLADYLALAQRRGGMLVADDTQALGILGQTPSVRMPYGQGGGGSLRWSGLHAPEALVFSSLAKGFGVPIAVLAGSRAWIRRYEEKSLTRVHCSPPSVATLRAAEHAVEMNRTWGDILRHRLALLVRRFREGLRALGLSASGGLFPIQTLVLPPRVDARSLPPGPRKSRPADGLASGSETRASATDIPTDCSPIAKCGPTCRGNHRPCARHPEAESVDSDQFTARTSQHCKPPKHNPMNETLDPMHSAIGRWVRRGGVIILEDPRTRAAAADRELSSGFPHRIPFFPAKPAGRAGSPSPLPVPLFPPKPADPLTADPKMEQALKNAIARLERARRLTPGTFPVRFTFVEVSDASGAFPSAGYLETVTDYIASEAKVAVMYSAYALRDMVARFAASTGANAANLFVRLARQMDPAIGKASKNIARSLLLDEHRLPLYKDVFALKPAASGLRVAVTFFSPV